MNKALLGCALVLLACSGKREKRPLDQKIEALGSAISPSKPRPSQTSPQLSRELSKCSSGDGLACATAGDFYIEGIEVGADAKRAAALYEQGCKHGTQLSCVGLARLLADGRGLPKDVPRAARLAQVACDAGEMLGCYDLALMYETIPDLLGKDPGKRRTIALYQKACSADLVDSCHELAMVFHSGRGGAPRDLDRARELLKHACALGDRMSCHQHKMLKDE
jgi:TPR repeat protein